MTLSPLRTRNRLVLVLAALTIVTLSSIRPAHAAYAQIEGSGSTWSEVIVQQWIADVNANGMKVTYNGGGSSQGRKAFAQHVTDFGITEIPYQGKDESGNADTAGSREFAYMPIIAGGTAFSYQIRIGGKLVKNLRLSGDTLSKIFTNQITNWNDPAIAKDNNGRKLPSLKIIPVVRSDGSGTTAQFTRWMDAQHPKVWRGFFGKSGLTSYYPRRGDTIAAAGSDQVMNTIAGAAGNGTIGYVEYSYPVNKKFPVVKVLNEAGFFVEPTQYNVAVALTKARINTDKGSQDYLTQILDGVYNAKDPRAYPLSSYSYMLLPTGASDRRMSTTKRQTLADFMYYSLCEGQSKAGAYGYSPLPLNLVKAGFDQLKRLKTADPKVEIAGRDVKSCNNPTFVAGDLSKNKLAEIAPKPAACDKVGAGPCDGGTGSAPTTLEEAEKSSTDKTASDAPTGAGTDRSGAVDTAPDGGAVDPVTGDAVQASGQVGGSAQAVPVELTSSRPGDSRVFGTVAVLELLAIVLIPGIVAALLRRRGDLR
ncbi:MULTISPECIES: substrate-binding domain-containing protein [unclassified Aeromicrobium]|uniref:substrate-binding domain-containing protein n=1 Tax=unclassified Aeromicrobium TaxID=2633570 RepID=UPI00396AF762